MPIPQNRRLLSSSWMSELAAIAVSCKKKVVSLRPCGSLLSDLRNGLKKDCSSKCKAAVKGFMQTCSWKNAKPERTMFYKPLTDLCAGVRSSHTFQNCALTPWGKWSQCSQPCGEGLQERARKILREPAGGGKACAALIETRNCPKLSKCPTSCGQSRFGSWGKCSATCGWGQRLRSRTVKGSVDKCGAPSETAACYLTSCPGILIATIWHILTPTVWLPLLQAYPLLLSVIKQHQLGTTDTIL